MRRAEHSMVEGSWIRPSGPRFRRRGEGRSHPQPGPTKSICCPAHFSATPTVITRPAPLLGEHMRSLPRDDALQRRRDRRLHRGWRGRGCCL